MSMNFQTVENLADASGVREGTIQSKGATDAGLVLGYDGENQVFRFLVECPVPQDETQVGARLGKKNKEGVQAVTSRIFGKVSSSPVYIQAPDGGIMEATFRLQAPVAGAESTDPDENEE